MVQRSSVLSDFQDETEELVRMKLFCDESASPDKGWLYLGILFVPEFMESSLLQDLLNCRCSNPLRTVHWGQCDPRCRSHSRNDTEVHFQDTKKLGSEKYDVAERWIDCFLREVNRVFLYVLGIDLHKIDMNYFGNDRIEDNVYNRFFRTAILKASKSFFSRYQRIIVTEIVHDECTSKEEHAYFPWHSVYYINQNDPKVHITATDIRFVDSDHRRKNGDNRYSHFLQFTDLVLGCVRNCLDCTSLNEAKLKLALKSLKLVQRLIEAPCNVNSSYRYVNRLKLEFFPQHDIRNMDEDSLAYALKRFDSFYTKRELAIRHRNQMLLF